MPFTGTIPNNSIDYHIFAPACPSGGQPISVGGDTLSINQQVYIKDFFIGSDGGAFVGFDNFTGMDVGFNGFLICSVPTA